MADEHLFAPGLFIEPDVFIKRMKYLKSSGYQIRKLDDTFHSIESQSITRDTIVLTIDDGFYSVLQIAAPILKEFNFPATLYLTSYYFDEPCPIFTLAVGYIFWSTRGGDADLRSLGIPQLEGQECVMKSDLDRSRACEIVKNYGQALASNEDRSRLLETLAELMGFSYQDLKEQRLLSLVNQNELRSLRDQGIDIQLHTHRHRFPVNAELAHREINDNRSAVEPCLTQPMSHFCYPSGEWDRSHWPILQEQNILTATTCESGLVDSNTPKYAMNRILDSARVSQIEFEAEVSGFNEVIRSLRGRR